MPIINHRQFRARQAVGPTRRRWLRWLVCGVAGLVGLFVVANAGMWLAYRNRVLPNYQLGTATVGSLSYATLSSRLTANTLLPAKVILQKDGKQVQTTPAVYGVHINVASSIAQLKAAKPFLPVVSLFRHRTVPLTLSVDTPAFEAAAGRDAATFTQAATAKHVTFSGSTFSVADGVNGYKPDTTGLQTAFMAALQAGRSTVPVPVTVLPADNSADLTGELQRLQKALTASISLVYEGKSEKPAAADIGAWYISQGQTMTLSHDAIERYVQAAAKRLGVNPVNASDAATASEYAVVKNQPLNFRLSAQGVKTYAYCVAQSGLSDAVLGDLRLKLAATYGDIRGWNNGGKLAFAYNPGGCQLRVWLAAPSAMASFGSICDAYYSCTVYPNVVINYDRWQGATDPWNKAGGNLEDYRVMVINHESGHWLGFGHTTCPAAGQPAPVMMQQSIDLGGCTFNPWPVASELGQVSFVPALPARRDEQLLASAPCCCGHCTGSSAAKYLV